MTLTYDQILQIIGAKELDIIALKLRVQELEPQVCGSEQRQDTRTQHGQPHTQQSDN